MPIYRTGLHRLSPEMWEDEARTFEALLFDETPGYSFDIDDDLVIELVPSEVTAAGYERAVVGSRSVSWDATNERWRYLCGSLTFGSPVVGTSAVGLAIFEVVNDDTDSVPLTCDLWTPEAFDGDPYVVTVDGEGAVRSAELVP